VPLFGGQTSRAALEFEAVALVISWRFCGASMFGKKPSISSHLAKYFGLWRSEAGAASGRQGLHPPHFLPETRLHPTSR
jgi:hypothetical protein